MLDELLQTNLFAFFLIFARVGAVIMVLPGFGEAYVAPRFRLLIAFAISAALTPVFSGSLPPAPESALALLTLLGGEIAVGFFIGITARIMLSALQVAGMVAAYQSSLANAFVFDPAAAQQGALAGAFLSITALMLIFVTNLHHVMLQGIAGSYEVFPPGELPSIGDATELISRLVARSFVLAMQIAAPFVVVGLTMSLGVGLLNRLMPQVQMFFVIMPLQILLGFVALALTLSVVMLWFLDAFETGITTFFTQG